MKPHYSINNWVDAVAELEQLGAAYVLVTVLGARGSTPRESGTKMVFCEQRNYGTIGGGHLEYKASKIAAELLVTEGSQQKIEHFPLGPSLGQCCGGSTTLLFESFPATAQNIMLFGAGHVGSALTGILSQLPCTLHWVDSREQQHPVLLAKNVIAITSDCPADEVGKMPAGSDYLIMTHNHQLDFEILEAALQRSDARYIGLIGSSTKWRRFQMRLEHKGYSPEHFAHVHCPIGNSSVPGKRPIEVAVSVAAELIALNHSGDKEQMTQRGVGRKQAQSIQTELNREIQDA
ncbi:MAG: xanthine dehydrogenase accessory protein XdhC [Halioglobus sp.]